MKIQIREKLKPFSHTPGAHCLLPGTKLVVTAFPTLVRVGEPVAKLHDSEKSKSFATGSGEKEFHLDLTGPVRGLTLEQDLEKNCVNVFGEAKEGFYRLQIRGQASGFEVTLLNAPSCGLLINHTLHKRKEKIICQEPLAFSLPSTWERLSLGSQKKQDWDLVLRRFDLKEILPILFGLSQKVPPDEPPPEEGGMYGRGFRSLAEEFGSELPGSKGPGFWRPDEKGEIPFLKENDLEAFCRTAFSGILVPRLDDAPFQGIQNPLAKKSLSQAFSVIRSLFFQQKDKVLSLLPANPFPAGRIIHLQVPNLGEIDLEWGSWKLRRVCLRACLSGQVQFNLPSGFTSFRVRTFLSQKGNRHSKDAPLRIEIGKTYFLDRFQK